MMASAPDMRDSAYSIGGVRAVDFSGYGGSLARDPNLCTPDNPFGVVSDNPADRVELRNSTGNSTPADESQSPPMDPQLARFGQVYAAPIAAIGFALLDFTEPFLEKAIDKLLGEGAGLAWGFGEKLWDLYFGENGALNSTAPSGSQTPSPTPTPTPSPSSTSDNSSPLELGPGVNYDADPNPDYGSLS